MPTRSRIDDAPSYDPSVDRIPPSIWHGVDAAAQRIVAWSLAGAVIIGVCAWAAKTIATDTRLTKLETEVSILHDELRAVKNVTCFLAKKSDQPITPPECNNVK